nr:uncharacterized mitochondrial protein AtMg00810-like [Tanacetum cinerariifolium]
MLGIKCLRHSHCSDEFPLPDYFSTACEDRFPLLSERDAPAEEVCLLMKSRINCGQRHINNSQDVCQIQQYLQNEHYALWDVIEFGDSYEAPKDVADTGSESKGSAKKKGRTVAVTTEDMQKRKNDVKARTTLLLALPDEHQLRFSKLQAIVSHLEFMDVEIEQDDLNQNFLTSLTPEWLMYTIVWRNRSDLDTMSLDDLYNHLKVYEPEVQKKSESNSQNTTFISLAKNSSGKEEVNTSSFPTANTQVSPASANVAAASFSHDTVCAHIASQSNGFQIKYEDINQIDEDDIEEMDIKWNMALLSMRADRFWKKTEKKITMQGTDVAGSDKSKVECFNCHKMSHFAREYRAPKSQDRGRRENFKQGSKTEEQAPKALMTIDEDTVLFPPPAQVYSPPKKDMSWTGLPEFADDTITDYSRPSHSVESNSNDLQSSNSSVSENGESSSSISSKPVIKFVKAADSPTGNSQNVIDDKGYRDSGCSRHMTGNISYLSDYEPYDGGYVSFGQGGGKITGKGIIKTGKLEFENVYFVKDLKYNLFSLSQICDNKNSVLFTNSECIVLGRDFKLKDDTNVFLRTPRQHNMYSIDLNNIVPHKDLTCLVAKASADECMLWHRRLGHLNFKTMNKLVRHNLVRDHLGKFDAKGDEGYFIGYSMSSKAFRVFNNRTKRVEKNLHVDFLENKPIEKGAGLNWLFDIDSLTNSMNYVPVVVAGTYSTNFSGTKDATSQDVKKDVSSLRYIALSNCGNSNITATSTNPSADQIEILTVETAIPTISSHVPTACLDDSPEPSSDTRLISKKVTSQDDTPSLDNILNLSNRIHKDHPKSQIIGPVDTPVQTRTKSKKMEEQIYQMDVKSAFLYSTIDEEVYVMQPLGFQDPEFPARVYKVKKAMYGLHQAPRAWYDVRSAKTPMDKENPWGKDETGKDVDLHLYRSMIGSLMYLTASRPNIMFDVCACARHQVTPKECHLHAVKRIFRYLKGHSKLGLWYPKESPFDLVAYSDSDYGGATQDLKSTTGGCQFLAASGCGQVLWIQNQLLDYGISKPCEALSKEITSSILLLIETTDEGTKILATVDGKLRTISESSIRRNLKLNNEAGISTLPDAELFENLTLMGYNILPNQKFTFQKGQFSHQWKYLIHTIMQCLSSKSTDFNEFISNIATVVGEGSGTPTEPHHTPSPEAQQSSHIAPSSPSLPPAITETIPTLTPIEIPTLSQGEACPTVPGLEARQDRANILTTSTLPHDSTPMVTSLAADEGSMQQQLYELTDLCTRLQRQQSEMATKFAAQELEIASLKARIKLLEDKDEGGAEPSGEDATIKGRSLETGEEAVVERSTERGKVSTVGILTGSGMVPTASPIFTTASVVTPYSRRKAREMEEQMVREDQRRNEQIARDAEIARIHTEEELQMLIDGLDRNNETVAKLEQESPKKMKTSEEVSQEDLKEMMQLVPVEETGRKHNCLPIFCRHAKHFDREDLNQLWTLMKETLSIRQATSDKEKELWVELKRLFEPDVEDQLWTHTQALMHDPVEWRLYDSCGVHHVLTRDQEIFMLVEKDCPLRKGLAIVMISNKLQVENYL